ncbi:MAG: DNA-binding protein [Thermoproteota archaeon]
MIKIKDIGNEMDGITVEGRLVEKSEVKILETRYGPALYAKAVLEDETGKITLNLWRDQTKVEVGDIIRIENGFTKFGELSVGKRGRILILRKARSG